MKKNKVFNLIKVILLIPVLILLLISCKQGSSDQYADKPPERNDDVLEEDSLENENYKPPEDQSIALLPNEWEGINNLPEIPHYNIQLQVDFDNGTFKGSSKINYTNLEEVDLDCLYFRLFPNGGWSYGNGFLEVYSTKVDDQEVQTELSLDDSVLRVKLPEPIIVGENIKITISFNGKVPQDLDGDGYGIYNLSDDVLTLAGWFPILAVYDDEGWNLDPGSNVGDSVYSDMAFYSVELTAPGDLKVATTGSLADSQACEDGQTCHSFVSGPARDFILVLGRDFEIISKEVQGTKINAYYLPDHKDAADDTLSIAVDSLKTFNSKFGSYPYTELDIVDVPMVEYIGIEFPGIVLNDSTVYGNAEYTSHEIAHQWWYNVVGNDVIDDPWLDEALTMYSSILYFEYNCTDEEYQEIFDYYEWERQYIIKTGRDDLVTEGLDHFEELGGDVYGLIVYTKGALFFHSLREKIGDEAFFKALKEYYELRKYQIASPEDLLNAFEKTYGKQLDDLYQEWLYEKQLTPE